MPPQHYTDARELLGDLLDRNEKGTASPIVHPDDADFADVSALDRFVNELSEAEAAGAIRIGRGKGRNSDQIRYVRLEVAARLYELLGRQPVGVLAAEAGSRLVDGLDLPREFEAPIAEIRAAWDRARTWQGFGAARVDRLRTALILAKAILEDRHRGLDYRTFSRKIARDSKALEKVEGAVVRLLMSALDLPPTATARPREALHTLGLEKFAPPLLLSGRLDFDTAELSPAGPTYFGIPPAEASRLRLKQQPRYVLTIENFASFNRHVIEADRRSLRADHLRRRLSLSGDARRLEIFGRCDSGRSAVLSLVGYRSGRNLDISNHRAGRQPAAVASSDDGRSRRKVRHRSRRGGPTAANNGRFGDCLARDLSAERCCQMAGTGGT